MKRTKSWFVSAFFLVIFADNTLFLSEVNACPREPSKWIANNPDNYLAESDIVFLGEILSIEENKNAEQTVEFKIIQLFKGLATQNVTIINPFSTSCSRAFHSEGSKYFVFGNLDDSERKNVFKIGKIATFVPFSVAQRFDMQLRLPPPIQRDQFIK